MGSIIKPGQVVVIANQGLLFSQVHRFQPDYELLDSDQTIPDMFTQYAGDSAENEHSSQFIIMESNLQKAPGVNPGLSNVRNIRFTNCSVGS